MMQNKPLPLRQLFKNFQKGKGAKLAIALGALGVLLILLSEWLPQDTAPAAGPDNTPEALRIEMEESLQELLTTMEGVGECRVYVTLESGVEYVYAKEQKEISDYEQNGEDGKVSQSANTQESVILVDGNNGKTGLLLTELQPQVKGVVVVCNGGDDPAVIERVVRAVTTALNISTRRVCVTK